MPPPLVSVMIPVYNGETTLSRCLDSVMAQTYANYEVILVDNNSTDKTRVIMDGFAAKDRRVRCVFESRVSSGAARNKGIAEAKGEVVAMTDADCEVPSDWLVRITAPIVSGEESAVMGFEEDLVKNYWARHTQKASWDFTRLNIEGGYINHLDIKNFAVRADLLKKVMFDPDMCRLDDLDLFLRLRKFTKIRFMPSVRVGHNHRSRFRKVAFLNFERACCVFQIYRKYPGEDLEGCRMMESVSVKNFVLFGPWMAYQFLKRPPSEACFLLVTEMSWRAGLVWSALKYMMSGKAPRR